MILKVDSSIGCLKLNELDWRKWHVQPREHMLQDDHFSVYMYVTENL